ncbi:hypothetical protein NQZ68_017748 [Dissostichus eleginoides]|nr:hypothetical protein NQZ68_017748 [Dissostichus eleginoides]
MKTIRVLVLLLLVSVHVFTPVSSNDPAESKLSTTPKEVTSAPLTTATTKAPTAAPTATTTAAPTATTAAPTATTTAATTTKPTTASQAAPTTAPTASPTKPTTASPAPAAATPPSTPTPVSPTAPVDAMPKSPDNTKVTTQAHKTATPTATSTDKKVNTSPAVHVNGTGTETVTHNPMQPRSPHQPSVLNPNKTNENRGQDESTEKPNKGLPNTVAPPPGHQNETSQDAGSQTGKDLPEEPTQSDKRLWWIVLPVLLVAAAAFILLKFQCKKIHDHTETIDTGTENASFQSRPESTKDGVMLLGVKSSGGDENAAAR